MAENREIKAEKAHALQRPHQDLPTGFVTLRLRTEPDEIIIEVDCPSVIVGRESSARLRLAYPEVSRRHCRFAFEKGQWRIYDLKSLNGVYLNGQSVTAATLYAGDRLRIGSVFLHVEAATPVRLLETAGALDQDKLRQIVQSFPSDRIR